MVHKNFQLFSAVLVANEHTHFGDMSSFVQDLNKKWLHKGDMVDMALLCSASFWICTAQRWHGGHVMHLCSEMLYAILTRL